MKIVHLTDTYAPAVGGIETQVRRLAAEQVALGHDVTVVSRRRTTGPAAVREAGVLIRRPTRAVHPLAALPLHVDDMDADVFHAHLSVVSPGTLRAAATVHAVARPLAVTVHSMWPAGGPWAPTTIRMAGLDDDAVAWSAVSTPAAMRVRAALTHDRPVDVVPNLVDTTWWANPGTPDAGDRVHAVIVGRLARRKRVLRFLAALAQDWPERLHVTVVGDGPERARIAALLERAGIGDRVDLVGVRSARGVRALLHGADLFVAPSALESFGIAALEARAAGLPVLARRGTGVADFVTDGVDGWFADDDEGLAAGLAALVASPAQLRALGEQARRTPPRVDRAGAVSAVGDLLVRGIEACRAERAFAATVPS